MTEYALARGVFRLSSEQNHLRKVFLLYISKKKTGSPQRAGKSRFRSNRERNAVIKTAIFIKNLKT